MAGLGAAIGWGRTWPLPSFGKVLSGTRVGGRISTGRATAGRYGTGGGLNPSSSDESAGIDRKSLAPACVEIIPSVGSFLDE